MAYNPSDDVVMYDVGSFYVIEEEGGTRAFYTCRIMKYGGGQPKVALAQKVSKKDGSTISMPVRRLDATELNGFLPLLAAAAEKLKDEPLRGAIKRKVEEVVTETPKPKVKSKVKK